MTKFELFLQDLNGKSIDIIGIGVSNTPLIKLLSKNGAKVRAFDKNTEIDKEQFNGLEIEFVLGDDYLEKLGSEIIYRTPGMHPRMLEKQVEKGCEITSEMEMFFETCPCKIIAVTGSDGKTTTTTLIAEILKNEGYTVHVGGNIGTPLLATVPQIKEEDICVVELSSFQLQTMKKSADIAVITNITPNHLDMHTDMQEYIDAKTNVFKYQNESNMLITNLDDHITKDYKSKGTNVYFSKYKHSKLGVFLEDDKIILDVGTQRKTILDVKDIALPGFHNVLNYMTAICATYKLVNTDKIHEVAKNFRGVEHRIEFVREYNGVKYFNDSIATSPTRAIAGLKSFDKKVIQIAGGYDKKIPFEPLAPVISKNVKSLILVGDTAEKIEKAVREIDKEIEIIICDDFSQAVNKSKEIAKQDDVVILSPACAAFDLFKNFAVRGKTFKDIVNEWR